jgi:amino acid adenylation domain-containing protein
MSDFECTLQERFLRGLAVSPDREAIRVGGQSITYREAHDLSLTWAGSLLRACASAPKAIGVLAGKGIDAYIGILAALYCGVPAVPFQPDFPLARIRHTIRAANISALVTDERGYRLLPDVLDAGDSMPILRPGAGSALDARFALTEPRLAGPSDPAYILFTSGSTGRPKGVVITHGNLDHYFRSLEARYDFGPDDVFSQTFDPAFDCAMFDLFAAWGCGGTLVSVPGRAYSAMPQFLTAEGVTVWYSTPAAISVLARRGGLAENAMPTLRLSMFAGDALTAADAAAWQRAAPASIVDCLYGPTETTITCTAYRWSADSSPAECLNGIVPIGRFHNGHEYFLLDEHGGPDPIEGELCVRGPQVTPGYLDPEDDEGRFLEHDSRRWYRTGDRVRLSPRGDLLFLGRIDNQVQVQGWRIELGEIDHHVRQFGGINDVVTVTATVDGRPELFVFYTGVPARPAEFARHLLRTLPQQMIPRHYSHLDEMPLSRNGKLDRPTLRKLAGDLCREAHHQGSGEKVLR